MSNDVKSGQGGCLFLVLLAGVLAALKLAGIVAWGWLWVLAPLWVPLVVVAGVLLVALLVGLYIGRSK